ncbi:MAG: hypothetical protein IKP15_07780 [Bacteroidales bacterium]|nr:hypothetical protein [Bacteroidales bacterium]
MKLLLTFAMILPLLSPFGTKSSGKNPKPDGASTSYEFRYSGTMMYPITFYEVKRDSTGAVRIAYLEHNGTDVIVIPAPEDIFDRIDQAVVQYKLHKLKNTYWPRMEVLDGYGWHVRIRFQRNSIYAGGSNAWPAAKIYAGITAINNHIQSLIDASSEADILLRQDFREYDK